MSPGQKQGLGLLSGIGVDGPLLIIAPPGNPIISLDSRLLDSIDLIARSPKGAYLMGGLAIGGVLAGALSLIPGGPFVAAGMAYLAHERITEGRKRSASRDLRLVLGRLSVALHVSDGTELARSIAERLSQYTRTSPITNGDVYLDAKRRLQKQLSGDARVRGGARQGLQVGEDVVRVEGDMLWVGKVSFPIHVVKDFALRGANLPLPGGRLLQAAMGLLVVAADERAREGEDLELLSQRIADYEKWTGRNSGR